jgi:hypothetical protein
MRPFAKVVHSWILQMHEAVEINGIGSLLCHHHWSLWIVVIWRLGHGRRIFAGMAGDRHMFA